MRNHHIPVSISKIRVTLQAYKFLDKCLRLKFRSIITLFIFCNFSRSKKFLKKFSILDVNCGELHFNLQVLTLQNL
jgi:hypothetical protein